MINTLLTQIVQGLKSNECIKDLSLNCNNENQMLLMIKPELFYANVDIVKILEMLIRYIDYYDISIDGVFSYNSRNSDYHKLIKGHFSYLNNFSKISKYISMKDRKNIVSKFKLPLKTRIISGKEYLKYDNSLNAHQLNNLWEKGNILKIRNGQYGILTKLFDEKVILINGFQPAIMEKFLSNSSTILVFIVSTNLSWYFMREYFLGNTDPKSAHKKSIRGELYLNRKKLRIDSISKFNNGFHLSAGPLEAFNEIVNILNFESLNDKISNLNLIKFINRNEYMKNALINKKEIKSTDLSNFYQITEMLNTKEAIKLLSFYNLKERIL